MTEYVNPTFLILPPMSLRPNGDDDGNDDDDIASLGSKGSTGQSQGVAEVMAQRVRITNMQGLVIVLLLSGICKRGQISFKGQISYRIQILYVLL